MTLNTSIRLDVRLWLLAAAVFLGVYVIAGACLSFPRSPNGLATLWIANGVPLAALLRTPRRAWPLLLLAAFAGNVAAAIHVGRDEPLVALLRSSANLLQYGLCADLLRRRLGRDFDLADLRHLQWIALLGGLTTLLKVGLLLALFDVVAPGSDLSSIELLQLCANKFLGLYVLGLPLLALSAGDATSAARCDRGSLILLGAIAIVLVATLGAPALPSPYLIMPFLMLLGWRHGFRGAGVGALLTIGVSGGFALSGGGLESRLVGAGYDAAMRGAYLEIFWSLAILTSLPLAVARARQHVMDTALAAALTAIKMRARQLAESEAAAREAEAVALAAKERLRRIIETSADIICTLDSEGRFLEISENCEAITGWPREKVLGRIFAEFVHPDDREETARHFSLRIAGEIPPASRNRIVRPDGRSVPMTWASNWVEDEQLCHAIGRDMTAHEALEARVQMAQRMEAIGQLTGGVAHDFNNLLTVVIGSSEALVEELDQPHQRQAAALILKAAEQGGELTRQLLAYARRQPLAPRAFDVGALIDDTAPLIRRTLGADLDFSIETIGRAGIAFADPTQTEAAILNLCLNARDAMPMGGRLTISTELASLSDDDVERRPDARPGEYVAIHVGDTGTGIAPDVIDRIFEPFFTTKDVGQGSGLGLSMVYGFIRQSGGYVDLRSEPGQGTTVTLYLPIAPTGAVTAARPCPADEAVDGAR